RACIAAALGDPAYARGAARDHVVIATAAPTLATVAARSAEATRAARPGHAIGAACAARAGLVDLLLQIVEIAVGHLDQDLVEPVAVGVAEDHRADRVLEVVRILQLAAARI